MFELLDTCQSEIMFQQRYLHLYVFPSFRGVLFLLKGAGDSQKA
jgi:hypothetical protein